MNTDLFFSTLMLVGALAHVGCDNSPPEDDLGDDDGRSTGDTSDSPPCDEGDLSGVCANGPRATVSLTDANNYAFSSSLDVSASVVRSGSPIVDLTFDWSGVTRDFLGHPVDPLLDIDMVVLSVWQATQAEIIDMMNRDALTLADNTGALMAYPNDAVTNENLLDFTLYGTPVTAADDVALRDGAFDASNPNYDPAQWTHMMTAQTGDQQAGKNVRMIHFFTLDTQSEMTQLNMTSDSAKLTYEVDLIASSRVPVAAGDPHIDVNWEYVLTNAMGYEFVPTKVSRVVVAKYDMTVCQIEDQFLDLETAYSEWYFTDLDIVITEHDLSTLAAADGTPFSGISADGTWILGLFCTIECANPAPLFMTVLQPC